MTGLSRRSARWMAAALLLPAFGVLFWAPFSYDDPGFILRNPLIVGPWPGWRAYLFEWYFRGEYEPLNFLLHRALWSWAGPAVFWYRVSSLLLHAANAGLAYRLFRRRLEAPVTAWWAAMLVALYPGHAETLAVSFFKKHLLVALFALATLNVQESQLPERSRRGWCWLFAALALLCRESAVMLPAVCALAAWTAGLLKRDRVLLAGQAVIVLAYTAFRVALLPRVWERLLEPSVVSHVLTCGKALLWDLGQLVIPTSVCVEHSLGFVRPVSLEAVLVLAALAGAALGLRWLRDDRVALFGAGWTLLALLPTLNLLPFSNYSLVANRYLYLASFGFYLMWARLAQRFLQQRLRASGWARVTPPLIAVLTTLGALRAAAPFCDAVSLWEHASACAPANPRARGEYARALQGAGRLAESETEYKAALALDPDYLWAYTGLASVYAVTGRQAQAVAAARARLRRLDDAEGRFSLGMALAGGASLKEARAAFERAVSLDPREPRYRLYLGICYLDLGLKGRAMEQWTLAAGAGDPAVSARAASLLADLKR